MTNDPKEFVELENLKSRVAELEEQLMNALKIEGERNALIEIIKILLDRLEDLGARPQVLRSSHEAS